MKKQKLEVMIKVNINGTKFEIHEKSKIHSDWDIESVAAAEVNFLATKMVGAMSPCFYDHDAINEKLKKITDEEN
jgi:hypothetical protein